MGVYELTNDLKVFGFPARSFPEGIIEAFDKLHQVAPISTMRTYYGVSFPESGKIRYSACANELFDGELRQHKMEKFTIRKGNYLLIEIKDFTKNIPLIQKVFNQMTHDSRIDPEGVCIEWYVDEVTCRCMVRMKDQ